MTNIIDLDFYRNFNIVLTIDESDLMSFCYYLQPSKGGGDHSPASD
ncbi:hypothetical protein P618_200012 [Holospora obtusa F1]|uniref:Uncharacterized protein n=1 Tax=Holospora obtusa F1 TaxID=1399147 RepID=W6TVG6_HOLOB|nr:hypothetical protein [Holospora obtusa]ETZ07772.1 hypothetical protein P618_200012 [Holospora obtusa F1]